MARRPSLKNPPATHRPLPKKFVAAEDLLAMSQADAVRAFADYDGPVRDLLNRMVTFAGHEELVTKAVMERWMNRVMALLNVIYKMNGVKTSYVLAPEPPIPTP